MTHIPRWRYWLSYLWDQQLEITGSEHNDYLEVSLVHGRLQLTAEDAIYSFGDYYLNFRKTFDRFNFIELPEQAEVLVLGLGLGSIPDLLSNLWELDFSYTAVEIDPVIIQLASDYSLPRIHGQIEVVNADALLYLQSTSRRFDLICMDVFQDADIPTDFLEPDYLELLEDCLMPGGAIIFNRLASTQKDRRLSKAYFDDVFKAYFKNAEFLDTGGNYMLLNDGKFLSSEDEAHLP
jgi:spermidine synthase